MISSDTATPTTQEIHSMEQSRRSSGWNNVGSIERWSSAIGGGAVVLAGAGFDLLRGRISPVSIVSALLGGAFIFRGATGHCYVYQAAGINTANQDAQSLKVIKSVTIDSSPEELYRYWRNFENLPRFMTHLETVKNVSDTRSHWVAKAPAGQTVAWDAQVTDEQPGGFIAWQSLEGADIDNSGSVRFESTPANRGTVVTVMLEYNPPAGKPGSVVATLFGQEPEQQVREDLRHFKEIMETGEIPTTEGQPAGAGRDH
ncbi:MAG: SRPBCC family protein [Ktedonobacteraceae bacterium]